MAKNKKNKKTTGEARVEEQKAMIKGALMQMQKLYEEAQADVGKLLRAVQERDQLIATIITHTGGMFTTSEAEIAEVVDTYRGFSIDVEDGKVTLALDLRKGTDDDGS